MLPDELERSLARHVLFVAIRVLDVVPRLVILLDSAKAPAGPGKCFLTFMPMMPLGSLPGAAVVGAAARVPTTLAMGSKLGKLIKEYSTLPHPGGVPQLRRAAGGAGGGRRSTLPPA